MGLWLLLLYLQQFWFVCGAAHDVAAVRGADAIEAVEMVPREAGSGAPPASPPPSPSTPPSPPQPPQPPSPPPPPDLLGVGAARLLGLSTEP